METFITYCIYLFGLLTLAAIIFCAYLGINACRASAKRSKSNGEPRQTKPTSYNYKSLTNSYEISDRDLTGVPLTQNPNTAPLTREQRRQLETTEIARLMEEKGISKQVAKSIVRQGITAINANRRAKAGRPLYK